MADHHNLIDETKKTPDRKLLVLHPFLFALYPIIGYFAYGIVFVQPGDIVRSLVISFLVSSGLFGLFSLFMRSFYRGGLATTLVILLFFSYGHVYNWMAGFTLPRSDVLAAIWGAVLIVGVWAIGRVIRGAEIPLTTVFNIMGAAVFLYNLISIGMFTVKVITGQAQMLTQNEAVQTAGSATAAAGPNADNPDIYYIIVDGYARKDIQESIYGIKKYPLYDFFEQKRFYVASESHANYGQTALSLASSLNMDYIEQLTTIDPTSNYREPLADLIEDNRVIQTLREHGYRIVTFESGYYPTEIEGADRFIRSSSKNQLNDFEKGLLQGSVMVLYIDKMVPLVYRQKVLNRFEYLAAQADDPGPKFVFAHFIIPHPPFLFDADGNPVVITGQTDAEGNAIGVGTLDGSDFPGGREAYIQGYRDQLIFTNKKIIATLETILTQSQTPPIIIVQSDHGPGAYLDWEAVENTCAKERLSIINAIYLPLGVQPDFYTGMTPVNTFRLLFNKLFGEHYEALPDRSYYSMMERPYDLTEVTAYLDQDCR